MDYILATLFALMVGALATYYQRLTARSHALSRAHASLVQALNAHANALALHAQTNPSVHPAVQGMLRRLHAIQTLGLPAIDQQMDAYETLWSLQEHDASPELMAQYAHIQTLKNTYNTTAFAYNDCQRSGLQSRLASLFGHDMAPPC